jgi:hypothetical protein
MIAQLEEFFMWMRPAFSRRATYAWFVIVSVGFVVRTDNFGVSSIVRALALNPTCYPCLLNFFHSTAWSVEGLLTLWWEWLVERDVAYRVGGRMVIVGDHTKTPKDGRRIPAVTTLHQDSETASKPSFFRGHHWGCIGLLMQACGRSLAIPLAASIQEGLGSLGDLSEERGPKTTCIVKMAQRVASRMESPAYLVLDAFFAVGSVFKTAAAEVNGVGNLVHILTRAKKNVVAYVPPPPKKEGQRGRPRTYGEKLHLLALFELWTDSFKTAQASVYDRREKVRFLTLDLVWRPIKCKLRFFLIETSRGRLVLMSSDLNLDPLVALDLYCKRITIETLFDTLKNILGGMGYHFWSKYLSPASRRPRKKQSQNQVSSCPAKTRNTFEAIEKFLNVYLIVLGTIQLLAKRIPDEINAKAFCWLRTVSSPTPSEFVTRTALTNVINNNLRTLGNDAITQIIRRKQ